MSQIRNRFFFVTRGVWGARSRRVLGGLLLAGLIFGGTLREMSARTAEDLNAAKRDESEISPAEKFFVQDYTAGIEGVKSNSDEVSLSWCAPDYKVPKDPRTITLLTPAPIRMEGARNDFESFQVIVRPNRKIGHLTASVTDLTGPGGALLSKENLELRYAYYHYVEHPSDETCAVGWHPDALVPLDKGSDGLGAPLTVEANANQPIWTTVFVPFGTAAGTYRGTFTIADASGDFAAAVPFALEVWDFDIPKKSRVQSAYGLGLGNVFDYHNCATPAEREQIFERYLKSCSDHRISPYDPLYFHHYKIQWRPDTSPPSCDIDWTAFDREFKRIFETYNFNTCLLPLNELGHGNFSYRRPGQILSFTEETPEYQAMFSDYMSKLQSHMKGLGCADLCYFYWFDEPTPDDYDFVADGFARLTKNAPELPRMLTEEPSEAFCGILDQKGAKISIWCPISSLFSPEEAQKRMDKGERFWWYVCTVPKAPYCTEFTDHPGHELRVWLWQTFERKITGTLIWAATYWTSSQAFPDSHQNPYLDPMSYVSGYGGEPGKKDFWGNGDGRLIYPPLSAAVPGMNDGRFIDEAPVSSIRWEELREGNEDYEFLLTLRELIDSNADRLTPKEKEEFESLFDFSAISKSMTEFTDSPIPIYERRRAVADAILRLKKK